MVVVDELDRLKESKDRQTRWRARYALAVLDRLFADGPGRARLRKGMSGGAAWLATPGWSSGRHRLARTSPPVAAQMPAWSPGHGKAVETGGSRYPACSSRSMAAVICSSSGVMSGAKRSTTSPRAETRNFSKFQSTSGSSVGVIP
jgi:hypothetical protein